MRLIQPFLDYNAAPGLGMLVVSGDRLVEVIRFNRKQAEADMRSALDQFLQLKPESQSKLLSRVPELAAAVLAAKAHGALPLLDLAALPMLLPGLDEEFESIDESGNPVVPKGA